MRFSIHPGSTRVGDVEIHEVFRVTELDAGHSVQTNKSNALSGRASNSAVGHANAAFSHASLHAIESQLAIIIPCMDEEQIILDGVLHGVPHECLIILVSNSNSSNFQAECRLLEEFCSNAQRPGIVVHQGDEELAHAFHAAGMPAVVVEKEKGALRIRNGKGEAMMIGAAIAKLAAKRFVGFIDADNFVAGSIAEYCKVYAAGLHYAMHCTEHVDTTSTPAAAQPATSLYAMVRIKWNSKPKVKDSKLVFEKSGRCSRVVNEWMNRLLNALAGTAAQNELIQTSNAGEHAMSLNLAMKLRFATGYAVEPFQLVNAWEQFGARTSPDDPSLSTTCAEQSCTIPSTRRDSVTARKEEEEEGHRTTQAPTPPSSPKVQILQVETRNPHFHDISKGNEHIQRMQIQGLSAIYHSELTPQKLKDELREFMKEEFPTTVGAIGEPEQPRVYPPMETMDFEVFREAVKANAGTLKVVGDAGGMTLL